MSIEEKKTALYDAVSRIIEKGEPAGDIKVSQIAEEAGIGKGTVYEYFSSREELMTGAMWYLFQKEMSGILKKLEAKNTFDERIEAAVQVVLSMKDRGLLLFSSLPRKVLAKGPEEWLKRFENKEQEAKVLSLKLVNALVDKAREEKLITYVPNEDYALTVGCGCFCAFIELATFSGWKHIENIVPLCRKMFIQALQE